MKKLLTLFITLLTCAAAHAVTIYSPNRGNDVIMETFFPMPYMSHSGISVSGALSLAGPFNRLVVDGKLLAPAGVTAVGVLNFSGGDWTGTSLTVNPSASNATGGKTVFEHNLSIQGGNTASGPVTFSTLGTSGLATMNSLSFAGKPLIPTCGGNHMLEWKQLTFGGSGQQTTGIFLTCGEGEVFNPVSTPEHLTAQVLMDFSSCDYDHSQADKACTFDPCSREYYDGGSLDTLTANTNCRGQDQETGRYYSYASDVTHLRGWKNGNRIGVNLPVCASTDYDGICAARGRGYACVKGSLPAVTAPTRYTYGAAGDWTHGASTAGCTRNPRAYACDNTSTTANIIICR